MSTTPTSAIGNHCGSDSRIDHHGTHTDFLDGKISRPCDSKYLFDDLKFHLRQSPFVHL